VAQRCYHGRHIGVARRPLIGSDFLGVFRFAKMPPIGPEHRDEMEQKMLQLTPCQQSA
jgi:hypothetical protein